MAADLTVDQLCIAFREFARFIFEHPEELVNQKRGLVLQGTPGDDEMRALMEAFGGEVKITIREMPVAMAQAFSQEVAAGQQAVLWEPSKEVADFNDVPYPEAIPADKPEPLGSYQVAKGEHLG